MQRRKRAPRLLYRPGPGRRPCPWVGTGARWHGGWSWGTCGFSRLTGETGGGRGRSCGPRGGCTRRRTGSCGGMTVRGRGGPTPTSWWITCGGWSVSVWPWQDQLRDLERYMGIVGAEVLMPLGEPRRAGKRPYGRAALSAAAACLKGFYLHQASLGVNAELGEKPGRTRLPTRADRRRAVPRAREDGDAGEPACAEGPHRRHPKMLSDGARDRLTPAGERGLRGVQVAAPARVPPAREPEPGRGQRPNIPGG